VQVFCRGTFFLRVKPPRKDIMRPGSVVLGTFLLSWLVSLAFTGAVLWVIVHFVSKFW